jgi:hypothetical protein
VHLFYRARLLDTDFAPAGNIETGLFAEDQIPDELAFRTTKLTSSATSKTGAPAPASAHTRRVAS